MVPKRMSGPPRSAIVRLRIGPLGVTNSSIFRLGNRQAVSQSEADVQGVTPSLSQMPAVSKPQSPLHAMSTQAPKLQSELMVQEKPGLFVQTPLVQMPKHSSWLAQGVLECCEQTKLQGVPASHGQCPSLMSSSGGPGRSA